MNIELDKLLKEFEIPFAVLAKFDTRELIEIGDPSSIGATDLAKKTIRRFVTCRCH